MVEKCENIRQIIEKAAENYCENTAFSWMDDNGKRTNVTYKRLKRDVDCLAAGLVFSLGLSKKKVAVISQNCYEWCVTYLACLSGAAVCVPIDRELSREDIYSIVDFADIGAVVCDKSGYEKLSDFGSAGSRKPIIITLSEKEGTMSFNRLIEKGKVILKEKGETAFFDEIDPEALAVLLFTSGTTGVSKGVMLSHKNLCTDLFAVGELAGITERDRSLSLLPLHHTYESIALLMMLCCGGTVCFCGGFRFLKESFSVFKPTVFVTVPLIMERLHSKICQTIENDGMRQRFRVASLLQSTISQEKKNRYFRKIHEFFGGKLDKFIVGAAPMQKSVASDFELFGFKVIIGYGLTECSPIVICNSVHDRTTDSVGRPLVGVQVKIKAPDEKGIGELLIKGGMVMKGYYNNDEATRAVFDDGWFCTGDLGYKDKNGRYHITGRSKNVIVTRGGKNVYPEELEYYLCKSHFVAECMVLSVGDVISCEILPDMDVVSRKLKKSTPSDEEVKVIINEVVRSVNRHVPSYKRIKQVTVRKTEFDKTTTRKIKRV